MANARILGEAAAPASANCGSRMGRSLFAHEPGRPDCHRTVKKLSQTDLGAVWGGDKLRDKSSYPRGKAGRHGDSAEGRETEEDGKCGGDIFFAF